MSNRPKSDVSSSDYRARFVAYSRCLRDRASSVWEIIHLYSLTYRRAKSFVSSRCAVKRPCMFLLTFIGRFRVLQCILLACPLAAAQHTILSVSFILCSSLLRLPREDRRIPILRRSGIGMDQVLPLPSGACCIARMFRSKLYRFIPS